MDTIAQGLERQYPRTNQGWHVTVIPLDEFLRGGIPRYMWLLLGVAGFVLLIACANVANLQFTRATVRAREIAVRAALGAGRWRIARQLLTESLVMSAAGSVVAVLLAGWGIDLIRWGVSDQFARAITGWDRIALDSRALVFSLAVAVVSGVLSGLAPAWQSARADLNAALREGGRTGAGGRHGARMRGMLVTAQIALAVVLMVGAGLMSKGFLHLLTQDRDIEPHALLTMRVTLPVAKYRQPQQLASFYDGVLERVQALRGVQAVAFATAVPHNEQFSFEGFTVDGNPAKPGELRLAYYHSVSPAFFRTLRIPLEQGRYFEAQDASEAAPVAIVSSSLARRYYTGSPLGQRIRIGNAADRTPWMTIVGVAADVRMSATDREFRPTMYVPLRQAPMRSMVMALRTAEPSRLTAAVLAAVREVDRDQPVYDVKTMEQLIDDDTSGLRFMAVLMSCFGVLALALAAIGVYAVMSYAVTERTHEIGVRVALGARPRNVFAAVLARGLRVTLAGVVLGMAAALALARALSNMIYGVSTTDAMTFTGVAAVLALVAVAASYVPARRALRVDPITALRWE
jgi:putative ABC transport system permease protein